MKKVLKSAAALALLLSVGGISSCAPKAETIKIGATITSQGQFAGVGVPYGNFYKSFVAYINENAEDYADAIGDKRLEAIIYDDAGDGAAGKTYIEKLINDDEVFALVGVLGTWNVVAAQTTLETSGVPAVYFGTGSSAQMFEPAVGDERYMMGVQPLYKTEGRLMYLRAVTQFENVTKIGVIHSSADDGTSLKAGIEAQAALDTRTTAQGKPEVIYTNVTTTTADTMTAQVTAVQDCDVIIVAANQATFKPAYQAIQLDVDSKGTPIITTYVNIAPTNMPDEAVVTTNSDIYGAAWVIFGEDPASSPEAARRVADYANYCAIVDANVGAHIPADQKDAYKVNAYAMSSYIAIRMFLEGLKRVNEAELDLSASSYLYVMEHGGRLPVAISGGVDYANGQRIGLDALSFVKYQRPTSGAASTGTFVQVAEMKSIPELFAELS